MVLQDPEDRSEYDRGPADEDSDVEQGLRPLEDQSERCADKTRYDCCDEQGLLLDGVSDDRHSIPS